MRDFELDGALWRLFQRSPFVDHDGGRACLFCDAEASFEYLGEVPCGDTTDPSYGYVDRHVDGCPWVSLKQFVDAMAAPWDKDHDQEALCFAILEPYEGFHVLAPGEVCGHPYYRHFDTYEDMAPVGCKYCHCPGYKDKE